jgi:hypothetical protein
MTRINPTDYVRPLTAARMAGLSVSRVKQYLDDGRLACVVIDGVRHIHRRDVASLADRVDGRKKTER